MAFCKGPPSLAHVLPAPVNLKIRGNYRPDAPYMVISIVRRDAVVLRDDPTLCTNVAPKFSKWSPQDMRTTFSRDGSASQGLRVPYESNTPLRYYVKEMCSKLMQFLGWPNWRCFRSVQGKDWPCLSEPHSLSCFRMGALRTEEANTSDGERKRRR